MTGLKIVKYYRNSFLNLNELSCMLDKCFVILACNDIIKQIMTDPSRIRENYLALGINPSGQIVFPNALGISHYLYIELFALMNIGLTNEITELSLISM